VLNTRKHNINIYGQILRPLARFLKENDILA
jgi:hypothetical protein